MQGGGFLHIAGGAAQARAVDFWSSKSARGAQAQMGEGVSGALIYAVTPPTPRPPPLLPLGRSQSAL